MKNRSEVNPSQNKISQEKRALSREMSVIKKNVNTPQGKVSTFKTESKVGPAFKINITFNISQL